jgi:predicted O-methyltransferase YrrM
MLCRIGQYEKCLEIGVFTGYSSICIARGMSENGNLYAVDTSKEFTSIAEKYWKMAELDHKIHLTIDKGLNFLEQSIKNNNNDFDLIFIDADKENYIKYYEMSLSIIRRGGIIMIDNTIWKGKVMNEDDKTSSTSTIRELNNLISKDTRVSQCMVTMYDGMTICQKK